MKAIVRLVPVLVVAIVFVILVGSLGGTGEGVVRKGVTSANPAPQPWIQGVGYIEPVSEVRKLAFRLDGVIARCCAEVGGVYEKGAILMELDNQEHQAEVDVAKADVRIAEAERDQLLAGPDPYEIAAAARRVDLLQEQLRHAEEQNKRRITLAGRNAVTIVEYEETLTQVNQKRIELLLREAELAHLRHYVRPEDRALAAARVAMAAAKLERSRSRYESTILRAPFKGVVLEILRREGEASGVLPGDGVILFADPSRLRVRVEVDERFVSSLAGGEPAVIFGRGLGDLSYQARVVSIKQIMGKKTVFTHAATERKDLDVIQLMVETDVPLAAPIGLEVNVKIMIKRSGVP